MSSLDLGIIGNCAWNLLIDARGAVVWGCVPRFDGDPVFCRLVDDRKDQPEEERAGFFDIEVECPARTEQRYIHHTAVLVTTLWCEDGSGVEITDFCPRFRQMGRVFRPMMMVRRLRPVGGNPRIRIRLRPKTAYGAGLPERTRGSNHIRYITERMTLRLSTDAPPSFIMEATPFVLDGDLTLILGPDESFTSPIAETGREFLERTIDYWHQWKRYLSIPFEWQEEVIRAAITLKMCNFEETGGIVAAVTTSIPEAPGTERNWDYRYCWLRDAWFVVHALSRLGATKTMEEYSRYITNVVAGSNGRPLQPVYGVNLEYRLHERSAEHLAGYRGMGPVRSGNAAYSQVQHDVYGLIVLATTQLFFDQRVIHPGTEQLFHRLEHLGEQAARLYDQPDAGIWEYRGRARIHTFSSICCWAACDRLAKIAHKLGLAEKAASWQARAATIRETIEAKAWNAERNSFVESFGGRDLDASLLLMRDLGFLSADDPRFAGTVAAIERDLKRGPYIMRYSAADDFGVPETAFCVCTFWYIDALTALGRTEEARDLFETMLARRNRLGLLSEDLDVHTGELWGNFPQTYSMVGLINSAMKLSKPWELAF